MTHSWVHRLISNPADENQQIQREWATKMFSILGDALKIASYLHYWEWEILTKHSQCHGQLITFQAQLAVWKKSQRDALLQGEAPLICSNGCPNIGFFPPSYTFSLPSCSDNVFLLPHHHDIRRQYRRRCSVCQTAYRQLAWEVLNRSQVRAERKPGTQQMVWILADAEDEEKSHKQSDAVKRDGLPRQNTEKGKKQQRKEEMWMGNVQIILLLHLTSSSQPEQHTWAPHSFPHMGSRKQKAQLLRCKFPSFKGNRENEILQNSSDITGPAHSTIRHSKRERHCSWRHTCATSSMGMPKQSTLPPQRHRSAAPSEFSNHTKHLKARWKPLNVN